MKKYLMAGMSALALCCTFMSCSHDDIVTHSGKINIIETYDRAFIERFGPVSPDQDWGFGVAATNESTRAVFTDKWTNDHKCEWESKLAFKRPTELDPDPAVDITKANFDKNRNVYYVPETFNDVLDLSGLNFNFNAGVSLYNYGTIKGIKGTNFNGTVNIYNAGTWYWAGSQIQQTHIIYNTGTFMLTDNDGYNKIEELYNSGSLTFEVNADIPNRLHLYSTDDATITMPNGGDMKAVCDIHGTLNVTGNIKIQNSTKKYICGIVATGKVENVDGPLITSYVDANEISFDGNPIYLLPGGHMKAAKTMYVPNSNCHVYGHTSSVALIEATNFEFGNKNDFTHTFSNNIYFKVNGGYVKVDNCYAMGQSHNFATVDEYLAYNGHSDSQNDEFSLAKDRINAGNAAGSPACGKPWAIGTEPLPEDPKDSESKYSPAIRILAEDLTTSERGDFDFNDVVFDVEWLDNGNTRIILRAAGGTLPMTVGNYHNGSETDEYQYEVHHMFGLSNTNQMISTVNTGSPLLIVLPVVSYELSGNFGHDANKIPVMVKKMGEWIELEAIKGKAPKKIAVTGSRPRDFMWCDERQSIEEKYGEFIDWVGNPSVKWY